MCYTVDPNEYKHKIDLKGELYLTLFIHYNEDRQMEDFEISGEPFVIVDTIGKFSTIFKLIYCRKILHRKIKIVFGLFLQSQYYERN